MKMILNEGQITVQLNVQSIVNDHFHFMQRCNYLNDHKLFQENELYFFKAFNNVTQRLEKR